ncbi:dihydroorotate dehydrogenase-like protein [Saccharicrinis fermentans]|uniref:dihydrouracil dehydrogenase (NAD(+)) n=1 Tax=Saccharicrinis fermentans DSM 9555 = JCM 21142 TaxID=869213 RepID=W7Y433_9BACT|nr:dihydroorotate dehydrogenase-like protein [Saccharicrinis fermentans]GAF02333.1 NAD-dependent dihydropyrimidine dehydrogenase subunit PreA [Saccharicrinis fermentans DSM 9555 = JCM 21142]
MTSLNTTYLGLKLKNPIIVSSSGLTNTVEKIQKQVDAGAGAIVLKSLFEEQINHDINREIKAGEGFDYPEAMDYIAGYTQNNSVGEYLQLITDAKNKFDIPIIASINCFSSNQWISFAKQIEEAGADAIELNIHVVNSDKNVEASVIEGLYYSVAENINKVLNIPFSMKIGDNFANIVGVVNKLYALGAKGVVLFNRFYQPDIDINALKLTSASVFSTPDDIRRSLRWVAIVSDKIEQIDISASTGNHDGEAVIKQLLAGASTVQVCSAIYQKGAGVISDMLNELSYWMEEKKFESIDSFQGLMSYRKIKDPAMYERAQFMRYFSNLE